MPTINVAVNVNLSQLTPVGINQYRFIVKFYDSSNIPLAVAGINAVNTITVTTTSNSFNIPVPITATSPELNGAKVMVYNYDDLNCCVDSYTFTIGDQYARLTDFIVGAEFNKANGRTFSYTMTPRFVLQFHPDGSFSDATPGLDKSGPIHTLNGKNVFYAIGYKPMESGIETNIGATMQNINLVDAIYTLRQYVCEPGAIPNFTVFKEHFDGWSNQGPNADNASMAQIFLSIISPEKIGNAAYPDWLVCSKKLISQNFIAQKDWRPYYRFQAHHGRNNGEDTTLFRAGGINVLPISSDMTQNKKTWRTDRINGDHRPSVSELYGLGQFAAQYHGDDINAMYNSQYEEALVGNGINTSGFYADMAQAAKGFADRIATVTGNTDIRQQGNIGEYGGENNYGVFGAGIYRGRDRFVESLSTHLYKSFFGNVIDAGEPNSWNATDNEFLTAGHINYRNPNFFLYHYNRQYHASLIAIYVSERIKKMTMQYGGVNRMRNCMFYTTPRSYSFVANNVGAKNGIELNDVGEMTRYPGGYIVSGKNIEYPVPWDEMYEFCLWFSILNGGAASWHNGVPYGVDTTKINVDTLPGDQQVTWKKDGESSFSPWTSGVNGAPVNSQTGLSQRSDSINVDALVAAAETIWGVKGKLQTISHVAHTSSIAGKNFTPTAGTTGLHLNGFGPINNNLYVAWDIWNQKVGTCLVATGTDGTMIIYRNEFLSQHLTENVTCMGHTFAAPGRQTVFIHI